MTLQFPYDRQQIPITLYVKGEEKCVLDQVVEVFYGTLRTQRDTLKAMEGREGGLLKFYYLCVMTSSVENINTWV